MKIENYDDLIVAFEFLIEEALELDSELKMDDIHEAFEIAYEEAVEEISKT